MRRVAEWIWLGAAPFGIHRVKFEASAHDTAVSSVESIRRRWYELSAARFPSATRLLITADCGGSNGVPLRLWKRELRVRYYDEVRLLTPVHHRLWLLAFPMRASQLFSLWPDVRPLRFRRIPF